jgi:integrase/recombinase XerD
MDLTVEIRTASGANLRNSTGQPRRTAVNKMQIQGVRDCRRVKVDRHGQAKILTQSEIQLLFSEGLQTPRDRALFGVCLYCCCRINEACTLSVLDVYDRKGKVRSELLIRKGRTKGKLATRSIPVIEDLRGLLRAYRHPESGYLFPGRWGRNHINADSAARILREAFERVGIEGGSSHSFRRTGLTQLSNAGIPLRVIQEISGHRDLGELQKYLEVRPEQVRGAVAALSMISHVGESNEESYVGISLYPDLHPHPPQSSPQQDSNIRTDGTAL